MFVDDERVQQLCQAVWELPVGQEGAFLDRECAGDLDLRRRVEAMLKEQQPTPTVVTPKEAAAAAALVAASGLQIGQTFAGRFRLREKLGEGGMGVVFVADQLEPVQRRVALKVIKTGSDSSRVLARFEQERQALALMDHPNIAKVLDAGVSGTEHGAPPTAASQPYFVMELIKGVPLTRYCDEARLTPRQRLELFIPVCQAVQHAHQKGIIHRDLKPSNILVGLYDGRPVPKVIDFGVAKATGPRISDHSVYTEIGSIIGTFEYMSPEQAELNNLDIDTRSDIYALGVILYELLTGSVPFSRKEMKDTGFAEMLRVIKEEEPPKPSTKLSRSTTMSAVASTRQMDPAKLSKLLRGDLDWITMKALEKDRMRRYDTANGLALDLQRYLNDEPVLAGPPGAGYQLQKFVRRNKSAVIAASLVGITLLLGIVISTIGFAKARQNAERADLAKANADQQALSASEAATRATAEAEKAKVALDQAEFETYVANLTATDISLLANEPTRMRARLDACPPRQRNWEWHYLNARTDESLMALRGHEGAVTHAVFSPRGDRLLTSSADKTARVWDVTKPNDPPVAVLRGDTEAVAATFSPVGDRILAIDQALVRIWNAESFQELVVLRGHAQAVRFAAFNAQGNHVITTSVDNTARLWDAASGKELVVFTGHTKPVWSAAVSPAGDRILTASEDMTARLWDSATGKQLQLIQGSEGSVRSIAFSPSGDRFVTAMPGMPVKVWDTRSGQELAVLSGPQAAAMFAQFSPGTGERILTTHLDNTVRVWDAKSGKEISVFRGHSKPIWTATFAPPTGDRIVTTSSDKTVRLWDARTGKELSLLRGHHGVVMMARFNAAGDRLVTASDDQTARVWDAAGPEVAGFRGHGIQVRTAAFSPRGNRIVTASWDGTARIWDAATGKELASISCNHAGFQSAAFSPTGTEIVAALADKTARVWDTQSHQELLVLRGHDAIVWSAAYDATGTRIVTASGDKTARIWDAKTGKLMMTLSGHAGTVNSAVFNAAGDRVLTAASDKTARIWDTQTGKEVATFVGHDGGVNSAAFNPAGDRVITTSGDRTVRIWDAATGKELAKLVGHELSVGSAAFNPAGDRIVSASADRTVRVWDARTGRELAVLRGHDNAVSSAAFSPTGDRIVTASSDWSARVWDSVRYDQRFPDIAKWRLAERDMGERITARLQAGENLDQLAQSLRNDQSLSEVHRRVGLALVAERRALQSAQKDRKKEKEEAARLNMAAWPVIAQAGASPDAVAAALEQARKAAELAPENWNIANTLGVALYRAGKFDEAVQTLLRAEELSEKVGLGPVSDNWAFLAMAQFKLGRLDEARRSITHLHELIKEPNGDTVALREAESLVEGKNINGELKPKS